MYFNFTDFPDCEYNKKVISTEEINYPASAGVCRDESR